MEQSWVVVTISSTHPAYRGHRNQWAFFFFFNGGVCISTVPLAIFHYNALLHTTHSEWRRYAGRLQIQKLPPSRACLSACSTLGTFERLVIRFIHAEKNALSIMAISFTMAWHGRMEKVIVTTQMAVGLPLVWLCPGKLHHFKMKRVLGNICEYSTLVVTLWTF